MKVCLKKEEDNSTSIPIIQESNEIAYGILILH